MRKRRVTIECDIDEDLIPMAMQLGWVVYEFGEYRMTSEGVEALMFTMKEDPYVVGSTY